MKVERFLGSREEIARKVAETLGGLYDEAPEKAVPSDFEGGRQAGLRALEKFSVRGYAGTRNKLHGNVSRLSFYIRHGVLGLREVAEIVARAGERGAVTIATNMAGRGTDIKLSPGVLS